MKGIFKSAFGYSLLVAGFGLLFNSCIKKPVYPSEPVIAYSNFLRYGADPMSPDSVEIVVSFTDNEGDIGLEQYDTNGIFKQGNLWMVYYYDSTGNNTWSPFDMVQVPVGIMDTLKIPYRVPPVLRDGDPSEPVKGLIYAKIKTKQSGIFLYHDRIKFQVYLYDLALQKSNIVETPPQDFNP